MCIRDRNKVYPILKIKPLNREYFNITYDTINNGDLTNMIGTTSEKFIDLSVHYRPKNKINCQWFMNEHMRKYTINKSATNKLKVVIFRDSYTSNLYKFLSPHFHEVVYYWKSYDQKTVDQEKPDIVISCPVERYLKGI